MGKQGEHKSPVLHVFICNADAYAQVELIGGWLTLPASVEVIKNCVFTIGEYLITDYSLEGSCIDGDWVQEVILDYRQDNEGLNGYIAEKGETYGKNFYGSENS